MNGKTNPKKFNGLVVAALLLSILGVSACGSLSPLTTSDTDIVSVDDTDKTTEDVQVGESEDALEAVDETLIDDEVSLNDENEDIFKTSLIGLHFEQIAAGENSIVAEMQSAGLYTFAQTAPSEYILTLENADIADDVERTLLATPNDGIIRSVRAVKDGSNVALRIFASADTNLKVEARGSKLLISSDQTELSLPKEAMAQADEKKLEETAKNSAQETAKKEEKKVEAVTPKAEKKAEVKVTKTDNSVAEVSVEDEADFDALMSDTQYTGRLISLDLQDTDIDNALRIIAEVSNLNIIASSEVTGKVSMRLMDVPWDQALDVILKTNGLDKVQEGNVVRIAPVEKLRQEREQLRQSLQAVEELEPVKVQYLRVSYAKAAELQPLVESVVTERGSVAFDERTNQLIVKDISRGLKNVAALVQKLDLRTPQVLLETQIVEASRSFTRSLGSELGFFYMRTPETGNALGFNFPNSVQIGGSSVAGTPNVSSFPASDDSSAISMLFGSADGSKGLDLRLSQAETEGIARVVSRPSVAVTNNEPAEIKSVQKLRIRKNATNGTTISMGQGAVASGNGTATETIEVGIILKVTAQASPDYYVLMDINAKSSSLGSKTDAIDSIPPEISRETTSTVLVSSGQTFALGGVYKISENDDVSGVPWLKDIPFLGYLFRSTKTDDMDEELIFFVTPRVIEGSFDDAAMRGAA